MIYINNPNIEFVIRPYLITTDIDKFNIVNIEMVYMSLNKIYNFENILNESDNNMIKTYNITLPQDIQKGNYLINIKSAEDEDLIYQLFGMNRDLEFITSYKTLEDSNDIIKILS